jgi:hypothetical protein
MLPTRLGALSLLLPCQFALYCRCLAPLEIFDKTWNRIGLARLIIVNPSGGNVAMIALPPFWQLVALLATHWVGDFVLQTNFQASNKNKRLDALSLHVATYTATLFVAAVILFGLTSAITFVVVNAALHFMTDYITSRISSKFWAKQDWHRFFATIGFDQLIHQATLAFTLWVMVTR